MELLRILLVITITLIVVVSSTVHDEIQEFQEAKSATWRPQSIKESIPEDLDIGSSRRELLNMNDKISSLETGMQRINERVETEKERSNKIAESVASQKSMIERLDQGFKNVEKLLLTQSTLMDDLAEILGPRDKTFTISNETCGEVLSGESGYIYYSEPVQNFKTWSRPKSCLWTIQAGHHSKIRTSAHTLKLSTGYTAVVTELIYDYNSNPPTLKGTSTRSLLANTRQVFKGPLIFVSLKCSYDSGEEVRSSFTSNPWRSSFTFNPWLSSINSTLLERRHFSLDIKLEYEGMDKLKWKKTQFSHVTLEKSLVQFSNSDVEGWKEEAQYFDDTDALSVDNSYKYLFDYSSITLPNFETRSGLKLVLDSGSCTNETSFVVIPDLLANTTASFTDCCKENCSSWANGRTVLGTPVAFIITKPVQKNVTYQITRQTDPLFPSKYSYTGLNQSCGGVLGGTGGSLGYATGYIRSSSNNLNASNVRCIWTIVPQPTAKSIVLKNVRYTSDATYARKNVDVHFYLMELTDSNGKELANGPKITNFFSSTYLSGRTFIVTGREAFIVFSADIQVSSVPSSGFRVSLDWSLTSSRNALKESTDFSQRYHFLGSSSGSMTTTMAAENAVLGPPLYEIFISSRAPSIVLSGLAGADDMKLELSQRFPEIDFIHDSSCLDKAITVYTPITGSTGIMRKTPLRCKMGGEATIHDAGGMAVIFVNLQNNTDNTNSRISLDYTWTQVSTVNSSLVVTANNYSTCGGVLKGTVGILNYKLGQKYEGNERCIWLIHCPKCMDISVTLLKSGFYGDRYLVAHTIDASSGSMRTLRSDHKLINTKTPRHTINGQYFVLLFQTVNGTTSGTGFSLRFQGIDCDTGDSEVYSPSNNHTEGGSPHHPVHYFLHHFDSSQTEFSFRWTSTFHQNFSSELHVIAFSEPVSTYEDVLKMSTEVNWKNGVFAKIDNGSCLYSSVKFYKCIEDDSSTFYDRTPVWVEALSYPHSTDITSCPEQAEVRTQRGAMKTEFMAFLAIYKIVSSSDSPATPVGEISFERKKVGGSPPSQSNTTLRPFLHANRTRAPNRWAASTTTRRSSGGWFDTESEEDYPDARGKHDDDDDDDWW